MRLSAKQFIKELGAAVIALSDAGRHAKATGHPVVDFRPLLERLEKLKRAFSNQNSAEVELAMAAINRVAASALATGNTRAIAQEAFVGEATENVGHKPPVRSLSEKRAEAVRKGGSSESKAKRKAARKNGRKSKGRPKKNKPE
jgi:hypothetical protein